MPISIGGRISYAPWNQRVLFALNLKGVGEYFPQEFDPVSGGYLSSSDPVKSYLMGDLQIIYSIKPEYQIIIGSKATKDQFEFKEIDKDSKMLNLDKIIKLLENLIDNFPKNRFLNGCLGKNLLKANRHAEGLYYLRLGYGMVELNENKEINIIA